MGSTGFNRNGNFRTSGVHGGCTSEFSNTREEEASFLHWLLRRCEATPFLTELRGSGAHNYQDTIDFKRVYTEVTFAIGSEFIRHALDDSAPIADLEGNKKRIPYCQMWGNTGATTNEQTFEVQLYKGLWGLPYKRSEGRGGKMVRLLASHISEPGSIPGETTPGLSHAGIVPDDAAVWRVFSGIFRPPRHLILCLELQQASNTLRYWSMHNLDFVLNNAAPRQATSMLPNLSSSREKDYSYGGPSHANVHFEHRTAFDLDDHGVATSIIPNWLSSVTILRSESQWRNCRAPSVTFGKSEPKTAERSLSPAKIPKLARDEPKPPSSPAAQEAAAAI
ncbi:hypothetical protein PR048_012099 [Dryococelus australis]|uniref:Uncharacterized protein n=1 Tax=Dryococelus australis TaxID=614101 RepID=A0ABQ9HPN9_9NEOP|nr:hypothetical protein PR048_012099 [Dryococelus australis]